MDSIPHIEEARSHPPRSGDRESSRVAALPERATRLVNELQQGNEVDLL